MNERDIDVCVWVLMCVNVKEVGFIYIQKDVWLCIYTLMTNFRDFDFT